MATATRGSLFTTKPVDVLVAESEDESGGLRRVVGLLDLTALGIGAIIGTGIFVILGEAIGDSGPAILLSFVLAGVTCAFSALSYAELASTIPVAGSAYTYGYATMGELVAWIIGWDLILEYGVSVAAVAVGWGQYVSELLNTVFGITLPDAISAPPGEGGTVNLPAVFLVVAVAALLILGVRESARANSIMVVTKIGIVILFIVLAFTGFHSANLSPFAPHGFDGVVTAASVVFFAYIGFDAISTSGEETIGTLFAFIITNIGVIVLRRTRPDLDRSFKVPLVPWFPIVGAGLAIFLMKYLEGATWLRFGVWLVVGLAIYFAYGRRHSRARTTA